MRSWTAKKRSRTRKSSREATEPSKSALNNLDIQPGELGPRVSASFTGAERIGVRVAERCGSTVEGGLTESGAGTGTVVGTGVVDVDTFECPLAGWGAGFAVRLDWGSGAGGVGGVGPGFGAGGVVGGVDGVGASGVELDWGAIGVTLADGLETELEPSALFAVTVNV